MCVCCSSDTREEVRPHTTNHAQGICTVAQRTVKKKKIQIEETKKIEDKRRLRVKKEREKRAIRLLAVFCSL